MRLARQPWDDLEIEGQAHGRNALWEFTEQTIITPHAEAETHAPQIKGHPWDEDQFQLCERNEPRVQRSWLKDAPVPWGHIALEVPHGIEGQSPSISLHHGQDYLFSRCHGLSQQTVRQHLVIKGHVPEKDSGVLIAREAGQMLPHASASRHTFRLRQLPPPGKDRAAAPALLLADRHALVIVSATVVHRLPTPDQLLILGGTEVSNVGVEIIRTLLKGQYKSPRYAAMRVDLA
jgi:hypothetical protein